MARRFAGTTRDRSRLGAAQAFTRAQHGVAGGGARSSSRNGLWADSLGRGGEAEVVARIVAWRYGGYLWSKSDWVVEIIQRKYLI